MVTNYEKEVEVYNDNNTEIIKLSLPGKPEYVSIARLTSSVIANKMGFDFEDLEDIKIAVGEACNNAVMHGKGDKNINFDISFIVEEDRFVIIVKDEGKGFKVENCPSPDLCNPKESGLGIFIIKSLMDEVNVESSIGKGTEIKMVKYL